jgi:predicted nucleotidyltransferase
VAAPDARHALDRLLAAAADGRLDEVCERFGVRLLGAFGSATVPGAEPSDLDLGVGFRAEARVLELLDALTALTGYDRIDLVVLDGADPVVRAEALTGVPLYQHAPGVFATEQMAALAERRDTEWLRRLDLEALR